MKNFKSLLQKNFTQSARSSCINYGIVILFYIIFQTMISTGSISSSLKGQLIPICVYVIMAVSLNLVVGISGELSLGHAGFMSVGAFSGVVVSTALMGSISSGGVRLALAIAVAAVVAAIFGFLIGIPVLRLRGDYLAIVTLAFGEIIKNVLNCLYVGVDSKGLHFGFFESTNLVMESTGTTILKGAMGATTITKVSTFAGAVILVLLVLFITQNLINSRTGRAIMAIRDNRIAAEACGLNVTKYKLLAFVTASAMAGAAGALYALNYSTVVPKNFDFNKSILILVFVVLGGIGNLRGSIIAAALLTVLPELLRSVADYRMLVYAIVLILVMIATNNAQAQALVRRFTSIFSRKKATGQEGESHE